jgi:cytochrome c556
VEASTWRQGEVGRRCGMWSSWKVDGGTGNGIWSVKNKFKKKENLYQTNIEKLKQTSWQQNKDDITQNSSYNPQTATM